MSWSHVLLGLKGRSTRKEFWLGHLILYALFLGGFILLAVIGNAIGALPQGVPTAVTPGLPQIPEMPTDPAALALLALGGIGYLVLTYSSIAISVKRLHDRGKSGWWLLLMFILSFMMIGFIWWLVELGFMEGQPAANKHGEDPLAQWRSGNAPQAF